MTISPTKIAVGALLAAALLPSLAFASDKAQYCRGTTQPPYALGQAIKTGTLAQIMGYGDCQYTFRYTSLNDATTRLGTMQHLSDATKQSLGSKISASLSALLTIKTAFDADTATSTAYGDVRSMFTNERVYALTMPQIWITAAADREMTVATLLTGIHDTLLAKVPSGDTADLNLLSDMSAKIADANTQANIAINGGNGQTGVANLVPDKGDATVKANNKAAITAARTDVGTGKTDLQTARMDAQTVRANLKGQGIQ